MERINLIRFSNMVDDPSVTGHDLIEYLRDVLGVGHVAFMLLRLPGVVIHKQNYGYSTYEMDWVGNYVTKGYWMLDPAVNLALKRASAFDWDEAEQTKELEQMWIDAKSYGVCSQGFTIPIHGPRQDASILSIAAKTRNDEPSWWRSYRLSLVRDLMPIAALLHDRCLRELGVGEDLNPTPVLSHAEREVLSWASLGKTAWETGEILGKSKKTVEFQLASCREKLGAVTIAHAVTKAVAGGLIEDKPLKRFGS